VSRLASLEQALAHARHQDHRLGVLLLDLDNFKAINDSLGHTLGDRLLREVEFRLRQRVRQGDTLVHSGGDKFLILLESLNDVRDAARVAEDLQTVLAPVHCLPDDHEVYQGASIGISLYPDDGDDADTLLRAAEAAMYRAKENGRGQFCFYARDMNADALALLEMEVALRRALDGNELELFFQPKADLHNGRIAGAEALLRWRRGDTLVAPGDFIHLAEKNGLVVPMGAWVIDSACACLSAWAKQGFGESRLAVNVSARQFRAGNLETVVSEALARHGVEPARLELELTESALMTDPEHATVMLQRLKDIGVRLSLDDFGTGYSSFAYLSRFPIDTLKVDQSFVNQMVSEANAAGIVAAIISLAHKLGLQVVAEGVETEPQLAYLRKMDCDEIQGYLFSRPLPEADFLALLASGKTLSGQPAPEGVGRTLLLVDDEPGILSALCRMLRQEGYRTLTAENALAGLELLAREEVQVVISDQRMPGLSGTEFLTRVKAMHPDCVRIILSGQADMASVIDAINNGAIYKFLTKPWDPEQLRGHIREAFRFQSAMTSSIASTTSGAP
jgi:diguanylate cyclase (GGDEF)-like protein